MSVAVRAADRADGSFLTDMLVEAAFWRPDGPHGTVDDVLADPELAHYVTGWPRAGDRGVVADDVDSGAPIGAAWWRFFTTSDPGYGFVDPATPELSMAVVRPRRGRGIGRILLAALVETARSAAIPALSLSVEPDNHARRLYERVGFAPVGRLGGSITMILHL